ncbi:B12-binding domain-containing radical SAM protein [Azospirillum doebereinerae]|uniref:B12-binding domain-containing radical SAM protein n=1 Tax=Azospirillum doebereinerae TaxID=92933 RepID=UPI001EE4F171|nr:radical SAM protein [Azospirillum doebereinerae]MCG5239327.1 B12-binding domain-containing radical SAM protein [Azospirillum doebereinerae]
MRILLIDAEACDGAQLTSRWSHHPLGLMHIAAAARRRFPQLDIRIFHTVTAADPQRELVRLLDAFRPGLVGVRALSIFADAFSEICRLVRRTRPDSRIIAGGPHASASFEDILERDEVDLVVHGEGEETFTELVGHLMATGALPDTLPGTILRDGGGIRRNPARPLIADIDANPWPAYDLIDLSQYRGISNHSFQSAETSAFIESSRGCPYRCVYCHIARQKSVRNRSPDNIVAEMERIVDEKGVRDFVFVDDIFNVPAASGKEVLRRIAQRLPGTRVNFPNGLRADQLDEEFLDLLEEVGTIHMALAVETASPRLQKLIGKHLKLDRARAMIESASRRFIVSGFFMVGFPTETRDEALATLDFARGLSHLCQPSLSVVRVYPKTPLWDLLEPTPEQAGLLQRQTRTTLQPRQGEPTNFYGDVFDDERMPLKSADIDEIRGRWVREVVFDPQRIRNACRIMERYWPEENIVLFYRNYFNLKSFDRRALDELMQFADRAGEPMAS